ncbi:MAG: hemerythrin family protein [Hydrogenothermaceae bacterium]
MFIKEEELPKVMVEDMNEVHETEVRLLNDLYEKIEKFEKGEVSLEEIEKIYGEFVDDVVQHFQFENELMSEYNFFAYPMHRGEHDRVLQELKYIEKVFKEKRDPSVIKDYLIYNFKPWLISHIQSMDTVTAMFLSNFI